MVSFPSQPATCMPSANDPCHVHGKLIDNGEFLLGEAARVGVKRPALDDCSLPPRDPSSLKSISRKRRRIECLPALASSDFVLYSANGNDALASCDWHEENRDTLVYQLTPRLQPLWGLDSIDDFEDCYIDIVETHFRAYEQGVLHCDINDDTALVHKPNGKAAGCLVDWDLACCPDYRGDGEALRRGAGPFISIDLQLVTAEGKLLPLHARYCHDLESLFWLLLWAAIHFDIPNNHRLPCRIPKWGHGTWADVATFKHCILTSPNTRQGVLDLALSIYEDLVERWVVPLSSMFRKARDDAEDINEHRKWFFNADLYAKEATLEKFMATIQRKPRTWSSQEKAEST